MDRDILAESEHYRSHPSTSCPTETCTAAAKSSADPTTSSYACSISSYSSLSGSCEELENQEGDKNDCVYTALPHLADLTTYMIQDIIRFSKTLRDFR